MDHSLDCPYYQHRLTEIWVSYLALKGPAYQSCLVGMAFDKLEWTFRRRGKSLELTLEHLTPLKVCCGYLMASKEQKFSDLARIPLIGAAEQHSRTLYSYPYQRSSWRPVLQAASDRFTTLWPSTL
jgi:hypothetical protein